MGYNITIGNAELESGWPDPKEEFPEEPWAWWRAKPMTHPEAPLSSDSGRGNQRDPSYSAWAEFSRALGLYEWMLGKDEGKMHNHPGCASLSRADAEIVAAALAKYRERNPRAEAVFCECSECDPFPKKSPAPEHNPNADGNMVRGGWLEFWVRWAVTNCERPCISNT